LRRSPDRCHTERNEPKCVSEHCQRLDYTQHDCAMSLFLN